MRESNAVAAAIKFLCYSHEAMRCLRKKEQDPFKQRKREK